MKNFVGSRMRSVLGILLFQLAVLACLPAQTRTSWRAASSAELAAALPSRAQVGNERIETELRTATGIIDAHRRLIAAVVLITAGYAADGKYSHFLLVQRPMVIGEQSLAPGTYVVGWSHTETGLEVHIYDAASGSKRRTLLARPILGSHHVESFHIWPPTERSIVQIGRYMLPYSVLPE